MDYIFTEEEYQSSCNTLDDICNLLYIMHYYCKDYACDESISYILPILRVAMKNSNDVFIKFFNKQN